jgi:hypothetical protein
MTERKASASASATASAAASASATASAYLGAKAPVSFLAHETQG